MLCCLLYTASHTLKNKHYILLKTVDCMNSMLLYYLYSAICMLYITAHVTKSIPKLFPNSQIIPKLFPSMSPSPHPPHPFCVVYFLCAALPCKTRLKIGDSRPSSARRPRVCCSVPEVLRAVQQPLQLRCVVCKALQVSFHCRGPLQLHIQLP